MSGIRIAIACGDVGRGTRTTIGRRIHRPRCGVVPARPCQGRGVVSVVPSSSRSIATAA
ncbi:hypothetical protein NFA_25720 [Nocardia farcinica IFM 10152]|uniref:Uncharacterized protein n=1 Tax=Nocardia farcinica (strain IFM 10152) TaxID=247156 RepID=Q5YWM2_NOCFA|nr:hypothetical protein NFA_25720 [Nocardia farcinica IFM 10152]